MLNKDLLLKRITGIENKLFVSKVVDKALKADKSKNITCTDFLDPHQRSVIEIAFSGFQDLEFNFNGGYDDAERVAVFFYPEFLSSYQEQFFEYPFKLLYIKHNGRDKLTHRDYLGSLMGMGIKREKIGDILVSDDSCSVVIMEDISDYIRYNLSKVGNTKIEAELKDIDELEIPETKSKTISTTIASLRLDCVCSAGFGISRSKIAEYIKSERVSLNWNITASSSKLVQQGDTISVKGKGRVIVESIGNTTRKGRVCIVLNKLV